MANRNTISIEEKAVDSLDNFDKKEDSDKKKSRWRDIERIKSKIALLKALREIKLESDPYASDDFMEI